MGRLAAEAAKSAKHVLGMCIRALDYLPPVDVTFHDYLRALITADFEIVSDDRHNYRVAVVEAFSRWGISPGHHDEGGSEGARALSADTLRWRGFHERRFAKADRAKLMGRYEGIVKQLKEYADTCLYLTERETLFHATRKHRIILHNRLKAAFRVAPEFAEAIGLDPSLDFEVHALRRAMRVRLDGRAAPQVFVSLTQSKEIPADEQAGTPDHTFRGGSTLVVDLSMPDSPKYQIVKSLQNSQRRCAVAHFARSVTNDPLQRLFFSPGGGEPFAALHELADQDS